MPGDRRDHLSVGGLLLVRLVLDRETAHQRLGHTCSAFPWRLDRTGVGALLEHGRSQALAGIGNAFLRLAGIAAEDETHHTTAFS
ncbi:hypothetical protein ACEQ6A_11260 [Rhizobium brockwellii]|uniref:hypothetical protein n=1 Tax=Rhizobium brockwellii TaxID=3019932 RepID=UPI003F984069